MFLLPQFYGLYFQGERMSFVGGTNQPGQSPIGVAKVSDPETHISITTREGSLLPVFSPKLQIW